jgi:hypothetical protein
MNKKNTILLTVMIMILGGLSLNAQASLTTGTLLAFDEGSIGCPAGAQCVINDGITYGSYWELQDSVSTFGDMVMTPGTDGGIILGQTQSAGQIDNPWNFLGIPGGHQTTTPVSVVNDNGLTKDLDFSGWSMLWNGIETTFDGSLATITCETTACAHNEVFSLNYNGVVSQDNPAGFAGMSYGLHLEGTIVSAVPLPSAVWLFGSGLIGLVGVARRKKA